MLIRRCNGPVKSKLNTGHKGRQIARDWESVEKLFDIPYIPYILYIRDLPNIVTQ